MEKIILNIGKEIERKGTFSSASYVKMMQYAAKHSMWTVTAKPEVITAFEAIKANAEALLKPIAA